MVLRIGSRESRLAVVQAQMVIEGIQKKYPEVTCELVLLKTTGDRILDRRLDKIGGKGLFTKELDEALTTGKIDLAVHSMKDLPTELPSHLPILAVSKGADPRDVLILPKDCTVMDFTKPVGSSSLRRSIQFQQRYPQATMATIRGNVETRIRKLDEGQYGAIILAMAGIERLGLTHRVHHIFSVEEMLPAACQGIICVQGRADFDRQLLSAFHDETSFHRAQAERAFTETLAVGCSAPVGAYATVTSSECHLRVMMADQTGMICYEEGSGSVTRAKDIGKQLAEKMRRWKGSGLG